MLKVVSEKNGTTHLYQDGKEIHGIKSLSFSHDAMTDKPELKVIFADDDIEIDSYVVPELPEFYKPFYKKKSQKPEKKE